MTCQKVKDYPALRYLLYDILFCGKSIPYNPGMDLVLRKFVRHFTESFGDSTNSFIEENGRKRFLLYIRPLINGSGNYYIESRTRSMGRTDLIIDYLGVQYIVEMKIWHGQEYNTRGEKQLIGYLKDYGLKKGYMLSFNFNKKRTCCNILPVNFRIFLRLYRGIIRGS